MRPVIIYPTTVDWDRMHQRPQQLLKALSRNGFIAIFGNTNQDRERPHGIQFLTTTLMLANNMDIWSTVNYARMQYPGSPVFILHSYPLQASEVQSAGADFIVFDSLDEPVNEFAHWLADYEQSVRQADVVIASATSLYRRSQVFREDEVLILPNGCDFEHFNQAARVSDKKRPIAGFMGAVATWLDWDLIRSTVKKLKNVDFVFVGPLYGLMNPPVTAPNVRYLGEKQYQDLPGFLASFDVCLIPFQVNDMTKGVSPIKMWEYLASGKPVVSTALPEAIAAEPHVWTSSSRNFAATIEKAMTMAGAKEASARMDYAKRNSWTERAGRLKDQLYKLIK